VVPSLILGTLPYGIAMLPKITPTRESTYNFEPLSLFDRHENHLRRLRHFCYWYELVKGCRRQDKELWKNVRIKLVTAC